MRPEHLLGAVSEHHAAAYFLSRGYQVFWPAIPQSPVDFVIFNGRKFQSVQVKTATWNRSSPPHSYLQARTRGPKADLYVIVHGAELWVIPEGSVDSSNLSLRTTRCPKCPNRWDPFRVETNAASEG